MAAPKPAKPVQPAAKPAKPTKPGSLCAPKVEAGLANNDVVVTVTGCPDTAQCAPAGFSLHWAPYALGGSIDWSAGCEVRGTAAAELAGAQN